jgi:hypothetical protein
MKDIILKKSVFIFLILFAVSNYLFSDSPLTSTPIYEAYSELEIIKVAKVKGSLNIEMAEYLSSASVPLDLKAALINALSWSFDGKYNSELYKYYLCIKYGIPLNKIEFSGISSGELFSLAYLQAMDDYFHVNESLDLMESVRNNYDKSLTVAIIYSMIKAQIMMQDQDWSGIWPMFDEIINDDTLKVDIRPEALTIILDYMILYR